MSRPGPDEEQGTYFPVYEELASDVLDSLEHAGLEVEDVSHELEPSTGDRTFHCVAHHAGSGPPYRYQATVHFHWDALLTYLSTYGPGSECELYHGPDEPCPHRDGRAHPGVDLVVEYDLGDGGYQLSSLAEVTTWVTTVEGMLTRALPDQDARMVRLNLGFRDGNAWVERFSAEQSWYLDLSASLDLGPICSLVASTLKVTPALADRLPL